MLTIDDNNVILTNKFGKYIGNIKSDSFGYYFHLNNGDDNEQPFFDSHLDKLDIQQQILGYTDYKCGSWPYCNTKEDVITLLKFLNTLQYKEGSFIYLL